MVESLYGIFIADRVDVGAEKEIETNDGRYEINILFFALRLSRYLECVDLTCFEFKSVYSFYLSA